MSIKEIELAISKLTADEVWEFARWFEEYQAALWDKEIEDDVAAGRLDFLIKEVDEDFKAGRTKPL